MFGNLTNRVMEGSKQPVPEVGMGATECMWSDRHAYTIIAVYGKGDKVTTITVQRDKAVRTDKNGMSDSQSYTYTPDPDGETKTVTLRKNGKWITKGEPLKNGTGWLIGHRDEHYDYSF